MNEHLVPVFELILPALNEAHIRYWIMGGIAVAGVAGKFIRSNKDADIGVLEEDYNDAITALEAPATQLSWVIEDSYFNERPKREFFTSGGKHDLFSLMPIFPDGDLIRFVFQTSRKDFPADILNAENRTLGPYSFPTFKTKWIKELFMHNADYVIRSKRFRERPLLRENIETDRKILLNDDEWTTFLGRYNNKYLP